MPQDSQNQRNHQDRLMYIYCAFSATGVTHLIIRPIYAASQMYRGVGGNGVC